MEQPITIFLELPASHRFLNVLSACIAEMLQRTTQISVTETQVYELQLAAQEVSANVVDHAYGDHPEAERLRVTLSLARDEQLFEIIFEDVGVPYEGGVSAAMPAPDETDQGGMGLFLIGQLVDEITYQRVDNTNIWQITKRLV